MSKTPSAFPSSVPTPAPSSPPASESILSELDGTAPSLLETSAEYGWEPNGVDSKALNLVSWKLDVNARAEDGVEKRGFNAISTVLNHPTKKANPLRSSRKPLPALTSVPPTLPRPPPPTFYDTYLQDVTPLYETFIASQTGSTSSAASDSLLLGDASLDKLKSSLPSLDSVPESFFDPAFDLANPSTWASLVDAPGAGPSKLPQADPRDVLASHLDTLERHLIHEITLRSSSFFSALSNLQDLHSESASCLTRITDLQSSLKDVGSKQAQKGLEIIDAQEKLHTLRMTERNVKVIAEVEEMIRVASGLVEAGDWAGGLGYLGDIMRWWNRYRTADAQDSSSHLPLATLPTFGALPGSIASLLATISTQLEGALNALLLSVLSEAENSAELDMDRVRSSLEPMLSGLIRCGKIDKVEDVWREVLTTSIREGSRKHLPVTQSEEDGDEEGRLPEARGATLADSLKSMDHSTYLLLSTRMFGTMLARLKRAQEIGSTIQDLFSTLNDVAPVVLEPLEMNADNAHAKTEATALDLGDVLASACELANNRASKILGVRSEQHAKLPLGEFVELFKENWDFVVATEVLAKRMIVSLRGITASQARAFLVSYHSMRLTKSAILVQEEQWSQIDVATEVQHVVNLLIESAVSDPKECFVPSAPSTEAEDNDGPAKALAVEDKTFFVVKATAESLVLLGDYLKIVINLELVVTDVMSRMIEFLKSFNSRTCQVVLGAGAMRSAGLKNITAKHLALASQSLSIMVALIPYIREFIRRHLNPKQAVMLTEFDKLKRDYQEHQHEIHAKLVAIMSDRLAVHVGSLRDIDWESAPDKDGPRQYAEMLVKETATLHKVLSKYLAASTVEGVLSEVLAAIVHRLSEEYTKIELKSDDAKKRMTQDVALIKDRLAPLSESGSSVASLETLVRDKPTPRRPIGQTMRGMLKRVGSESIPKSAESPSENGDATSADDERKSGEDEDSLTVTEATVTEEPKEVERDSSAEGEQDAVETAAPAPRPEHEAATEAETEPQGLPLAEPVEAEASAGEQDTAGPAETETVGDTASLQLSKKADGLVEEAEEAESHPPGQSENKLE